MPRIRPLTLDEAPQECRLRFSSDQAAYGRVLDSTGIQAYCPPIQLAVGGLGASVQKSGRLPEALKRLLNVKAASMVGCPF